MVVAVKEEKKNRVGKGRDEDQREPLLKHTVFFCVPLSHQKKSE